uniref:Transmembrane protein 188 n=1 Tax=Wuchereria bancrofti TaxID=6293 RepID=A0A1I8EJQ7_WUCBA
MQPAATRWRLVLLIAFGCTLWSAYFWLKDPSIRTVRVTLIESLQNHLVFSACVPSLLFLFGFIGIHNRAVAPSILYFAYLRDIFCLSHILWISEEMFLIVVDCRSAAWIMLESN